MPHCSLRRTHTENGEATAALAVDTVDSLVPVGQRGFPPRKSPGLLAPWDSVMLTFLKVPQGWMLCARVI